MYKKKFLIIMFLCTGIVIVPQSFVIKKVQEVVLSWREQTITAVGDFLVWTPSLSEQLGIFMQSYGQLQATIMNLVQAEMESKKTLFDDASEKELKLMCNRQVLLPGWAPL